MNCWFIFASQKIPRSTDGEAHRFGEKKQKLQRSQHPGQKLADSGILAFNMYNSRNQKNVPLKKGAKIERIKIIFLSGEIR